MECYGGYELSGPALLQALGPCCVLATLGQGAWLQLCGAEHDGCVGSSSSSSITLTQVGAPLQAPAGYMT